LSPGSYPGRTWRPAGHDSHTVGLAFEAVQRDDGRVTRAIATVGMALLILVGVGCAGGIGRERAIEIARREAGAVATTVVRVERGPPGQFADVGALPEVPRDREVWSIVLRGSFPGECVLNEAGESVCPPAETSKLVVIDAQTGAFIFSESPAP